MYQLPWRRIGSNHYRSITIAGAITLHQKPAPWYNQAMALVFQNPLGINLVWEIHWRGTSVGLYRDFRVAQDKATEYAFVQIYKRYRRTV